MSPRVRRSAAAAAAVLVAALLVAVALDALRWERRLDGDDLRFRAAHASPGLWQVEALLPFEATRRLLALEDDLAYRGVLRRYWPVRPGQPIVGPEQEALRGQVQSELGLVSRADPEPRRRSGAMNILGVLAVGAYYGSYYGFTGTGPGSPEERVSVLRTAIGLFQSAVATDPDNAVAKVNLELLLRDAGASELIGDDPSGQLGEGSGSGAGRGGSGY